MKLHFKNHVKLNAAGKSLAFLLHIQEILGSNLSLITSYLDKLFNDFPQSFHANDGTVS
jgi:hypothetical protein